MTLNKLRKILTLIAIAALIVGFFTLIGSSDDANTDRLLTADQDNSDSALEALVLEAEKLKELAPAAGREAKSGNLPSNADIEDKVFGFD